MFDNKTTVVKMRGRPRKNIEDKSIKLTLSSSKETREKLNFIKERDKTFSYSKEFSKLINKIFKKKSKLGENEM